MKTVKIILVMLFLVALTNCQCGAQKMGKSNVPENLKQIIQQKYGSVDVDWDKEGDDYEASFKQNGSDISVLLSADGSIVEVEKEIKTKDLPKMVQEALSRDFNGFGIEEAAIIESNGQITYEAEVKKSKESYDLIFDENGKLIKKLPRNTGKD